MKKLLIITLISLIATVSNARITYMKYDSELTTATITLKLDEASTHTDIIVKDSDKMVVLNADITTTNTNFQITITDLQEDSEYDAYITISQIPNQAYHMKITTKSYLNYTLSDITQVVVDAYEFNSVDFFQRCKSMIDTDTNFSESEKVAFNLTYANIQSEYSGAERIVREVSNAIRKSLIYDFSGNQVVLSAAKRLALVQYCRTVAKEMMLEKVQGEIEEKQAEYNRIQALSVE